MEEELEGFLGSMLGLAGITLQILYVIAAIFVVFVIVYIIGLVKFFQKCNKPGWAAIIPYYNTYVLNEIAGLNWWWFLIYMAGMLILPSMSGDSGLSVSGLITIFVMLNIGYNTAIKFDKKENWAWIICSGLFGKVFYACVGLFGSSKYIQDKVVSKNGFFKDNEQNNKTE